ncbi:MAG: endopeptidase La [Bdellovibrionaceae bacterium]|nr:endopeptidase La [Pseudobdellovibrionaceae bacterium]
MNHPQGRLPIIALKNTVIFPGLTQVVKVGRERSIHALEEAQQNGFWIVAVQQRANSESKIVEAGDVYNVGTLCRVDSVRGNAESGFHVVLRGMTRMQLGDIKLDSTNKYLAADATDLTDLSDVNDGTAQTLLESLKTMSAQILALIPTKTDQIEELIKGVEDLSFLTHLCAGHLDVPAGEKQTLLELLSVRERSLKLLTLMKEFKEALELQNEIRSKLHQKIGQSQRESILREQMKTIKDELGEGDNEAQLDKLRKKLDDAGLPPEVKEVVDQEWRRFSDMGPQSPESHMIRNYLETVAALPWSKSAPDKEIHLQEAEDILNEDHYGLDKIKKRILQQLAVLKLKKESKGTILLLVGPPGVGKTSLAQSVAKALGRKFVRASLGGIRDESDIRGHRRTYIGSMPGRIIQSLKRVQENNPVFLLDEIDKMGRGFHGDPSAALLEVLDPEQNNTFVDHYLDVPFDLSKIVFLATANSLEGIPAPLLDRMEMIELTGYTSAEKLNIARRHLLPKQIKELGLEDYKIQISDEALLRVITHYTREAGVRDLQRKITTLLRSISEKVVRNEEKGLDEVIRIELKSLEEILGAERYFPEMALGLHPPGVVTGLAWSPVGGDLLFIESTAMSGKGELMITGQLGDVMRESAQIALSLIRSHLPDLSVPIDLKKYDLHIHVPAGATPKDGPSAGVSILTSMVSLLTKRAVSPTLAMTGEVTLRGAVMPVGGIKEKVIAAHRGGMTDVILPERNRSDLKDIPAEVLAQLKIHFVSRVEELLNLVLGLELKQWEPQLLVEAAAPQLVQDAQ